MTSPPAFIAVNRQEAPLVGTVGEAHAGIEVKLPRTGDLHPRPARLKGYFKDPEQTARTVDPEGWLHTGDVGEWQGGAPQDRRPQEGHLNHRRRQEHRPGLGREQVSSSAPYIQGRGVIGDRRKYLVALILIDEETSPVRPRTTASLRTFQELTRRRRCGGSSPTRWTPVNRTPPGGVGEEVRAPAAPLLRGGGDVTPPRR